METLHGYMIDENNWVSWPNGRVNSLVIDNSAYKIIRLNLPHVLDETNERNRDCRVDEWFLSRQEIMELIPEENKTELGVPIDIFDEDGFFYIVYKEQEGIKLSMDDINSLERSEKLDVLLKVSAAIKILHDNGIVHGDLNPGCIEIYKGYDASIQVQILGFENYFFENGRFITPCTYDMWFSPEMALYQRSIANGSGEWRKYSQYIFSMTDVFSLGLIFHQYCSDSGILPICTKDYPWQEFMAGGKPVVVVGGEVEEIISKMIEVEPSNRPPIDVVLQSLQEMKCYSADNIFKAEHISEVEDNHGETGDPGCIEQDMLFDDEYYDLIFVINKAEQTKGWLKGICGKLSRFVQSMPFNLLKAGKVVLPIRTKIIWYGDIYLDGSNAISESRYFWIPDDWHSFEQYIQLEEAISGCDKPESGIEALCLATESLADSTAKFGTIILCSEFGAYDIEMLQKRGQNFSSTVRPTDTSEFISGWNDDYVEALGERYVKEIAGFSEHDITKWRYCGCTAERRSLILFTPPKYPWNEFEFYLERCIRVEQLEDAMKYGIEFIHYNQSDDLFR